MDARTVYEMTKGLDGLNFTDALREEMFNYCDNWTENCPAYFSDGRTLADLVKFWMNKNVHLVEDYEIGDGIEAMAREFANDNEYDDCVVIDFLTYYRPELGVSWSDKEECDNAMLYEYGWLIGYVE